MQKPTISKRIPSGIPGLDELILGGFVKGSVNLIAGMTGSGKTIFCLQFALNCLKNGGKVIYLTLEESMEDILDDVEEFGWKSIFQNYIKTKRFSLTEKSATDIMGINETTEELIKQTRADVFILDSLSVATLGWSEAIKDIGKMRSDILGLLTTLKKGGITSLLISEIPEEEEKKLSRFGFEEFVVDSVIKLNYFGIGESVIPTLEVRKMRRTRHAKGRSKIEFSNKGLRIVSEKEKLHF